MTQLVGRCGTFGESHLGLVPGLRPGFRVRLALALLLIDMCHIK